MGMLKRTAVITYREFDALAPADKKRTVVMWVADSGKKVYGHE